MVCQSTVTRGSSARDRGEGVWGNREIPRAEGKTASCEIRRNEPVGVVRILRTEGEAELAVGKHVAAVGERDGALRALLDQEHGDAGLANCGKRLEDVVDDARREAERRLV